MRAPLSRFSNSALTGTRVPRNTQAPLTRSGSRSTTGQQDQSNVFRMLAPFHLVGKRRLYLHRSSTI
jgi:hypothetical protein